MPTFSEDRVFIIISKGCNSIHFFNVFCIDTTPRSLSTSFHLARGKVRVALVPPSLRREFARVWTSLPVEWVRWGQSRQPERRLGERDYRKFCRIFFALSRVQTGDCARRDQLVYHCTTLPLMIILSFI